MRAARRRAGPERRRKHVAPLRLDDLQLRCPSRLEQSIQAATRYLFCVLGLLFFNVAFPQAPHLIPREIINITFTAYLFVNTAFLVHLLLRPYSPLRYRVHMWLDICMVSIALIADPNEVPPAALAYIMVVLGNGMRYGLRMFGEAVVGCFLGAMLALSLRYAPAEGFPPGLLFLNLFGGLIVIYAYMLMARVEAGRRALQRKSYVDSLTGLLNRGGLELMARRLFTEAERSGQPLAVMFADMDNFKQVNDRYGHAEGDRVLRQFAEILRSSIREPDVAARYGGDEFVLILPHTRVAEGQRVAERIQERIQAWVTENGLECSLSIGIGESPHDGADLETIMARVDHTMYATKRSGSSVSTVAREQVRCEAADPG
jgi:diguanylate cyclase (GGDEF)-like protein